jgi:thymidylate synthase (FAD)
MSEPIFTSDITVELVQQVGGDALVAAAARVSTGGDLQVTDAARDAGLIGYLMRNRHGSPFEHGAATFRVTAPVVTWWEHVRHRIGWSYNLESGRYKQLDGIFYLPEHARVQTGKPGHYRITDAPELDEEMKTSFLRCAEVQWTEYRRMLELGFANEVARLVLPFNIYYSGYTTANPRSIMAFMSLRTEDDEARYPSRPQKEVRLVGEQYEELFRKSWPATYEAWVAAGRVAP